MLRRTIHSSIVHAQRSSMISFLMQGLLIRSQIAGRAAASRVYLARPSPASRRRAVSSAVIRVLAWVASVSRRSSRVPPGISSSLSKNFPLSKGTEGTAPRDATADHEAREWAAEARTAPLIRYRKKLALASTPQRQWAEPDLAQEIAAPPAHKATDRTQTHRDAVGQPLKSRNYH